eukprot:m.311998 g.311998  ORF g.311998 m.311998 type:complete len:69 (+) comp55380_c0_seq1:455-661(+)
MMDDDMMMMPMTFSSHVDIGPLLFASWEVTNDSRTLCFSAFLVLFLRASALPQLALSAVFTCTLQSTR